MNTELSQRVVACKSWRWMSGMLTTWGRIAEHDKGWLKMTDGGVYDDDTSSILPDLHDPATAGCLLQLIREARLDPTWSPTGAIVGGEAVWWLEPPSRVRQTAYESYASALAWALILSQLEQCSV